MRDIAGNILDIGHKVATGAYARHSFATEVGVIVAVNRVERNGKLHSFQLKVRVDGKRFPWSLRSTTVLTRQPHQVVRIMEPQPL